MPFSSLFSNSTQEESPNEKQEEIDLEDGEIEDDDEDVSAPVEPVALAEPPKPEIPAASSPTAEKNKIQVENEKIPRAEKNKERPDRSERRRHDDKGKRHMTEAEKSILHLRKKEEMQRKKWEKINRIKDIEPERKYNSVYYGNLND